MCCLDWRQICMPLAHNLNSEDDARKFKSVADRLRHLLGEVNDTYANNIQTKANLLGVKFNVQDYTRKLFAEELLRGSLFFSLSMVLKKIEPKVRQLANLGDWLVISQGRSYGSRGKVVRVKNLADVMLVDYEQRTVLLVDKVNGEEEVPSNVQAIIYLNPLTGDHPDVLAHVSVRARNLKVMLAVVFDETKCRELAQLEGKIVLFQYESSNEVKYEE